MSDGVLNFKISSGLKRIIGRDLITNDFVAVFELVKNSFDAMATRVDIFFEEKKMFIVDNGKGMSYDDLVNKWLFVAYSAKKNNNEDLFESIDYRSELAGKRAYAGSKGVGRFSCDRLGSELHLQTRANLHESFVEVLHINWSNFEEDDKNEFVDIHVDYSSELDFILPDGCAEIAYGTVLGIEYLREEWPREKIISLKSALAKLINPFSDSKSGFEIYIHAVHEKRKDLEVELASNVLENSSELNKDDDFVDEQNKIVNGKVGNFIFETLKEKTTHLDVRLSDDGLFILSELSDRGEVIYRISEPNNYKFLVGSNFYCNLFYLNRAAKNTFKRRMGVSSVSFGSVFLFRNEFRVFPIGEEGVDTFGIDRRKQQGYARYIGTRDLVGRIDVSGSENYFRESTSRDQGLIETPAYLELVDCFWEKCFKRLENYVVGVTWPDSLDAEREDISRLTGDKAKARIIDIVSKLANGKNINLLYCSKNLIGILNEKSEDFERSMQGLKILANKSNNQDLIIKINKAEARYQELKQAEYLARVQAEKERKAREEAERRAKEAERERKEAEKGKRAAEKDKEKAEEDKWRAIEEKVKAEEGKLKAEIAYEEEIKRSLFLTSVSSIDYDTIVNLHHQIGIYSSDIHHILANQVDKLNHGDKIERDDFLSLLEQLTFKNQQVLSISRFATKANFRLDSEQIEADLVEFIRQYINQVCKYYSGDGLSVNVVEKADGLIRKFKPIEISILIDNLVNNAEKAGAECIDFEIVQINARQINIIVTDNGTGFGDSVLDLNRVFEKGFSTTEGSGLGLFHVAYILDQMRGDISVNKDYSGGAQFIIRILE